MLFFSIGGNSWWTQLSGEQGVEQGVLENIMLNFCIMFRKFVILALKKTHKLKYVVNMAHVRDIYSQKII